MVAAAGAGIGSPRCRNDIRGKSVGPAQELRRQGEFIVESAETELERRDSENDAEREAEAARVACQLAA